LQREHIRSPNPSLQKLDLHLRQARAAATSAVALIVPISVSADLMSFPLLAFSQSLHVAKGALDEFLNAFISSLRRRRIAGEKEPTLFHDFDPRPRRLRQHLIFDAFKVRLLRECMRWLAISGAPSHFRLTLSSNGPSAVEIDRVIGHFGIPPIQRRPANDPPVTAVILR
jgi:hypothetical protein